MTENHHEMLSIVIPAFNEAESLPTLLSEVFFLAEGKNWEIIIVNDASTDETKKILSDHANRQGMKIIHHKVNRGYGGAIKSGILAAEGDYIITIDADGQHAPEDIERLHESARSNDADMIVGSRERIKKKTLYRRLGKRLIRIFARLLSPIPIRDINSGMKLYRADLAREYMHLYPDSMAFSEVITLVFLSFRHLVLEYPIRSRTRKTGKSTINTLTALQTIKEILNMIVLFNPMKIFFPIAWIFIVLGLIWGVPFILKGRGVSVGMSILLIMGVFCFLLGLIAEQLSLIRKNRSIPKK